MGEPIFNVGNQQDRDDFLEGFRRKHPGFEWITDKVVGALSWYKGKIDGIVDDFIEKSKHGEIKDERDLDAALADTNRMLHEQEPDLSGGSDNPPDNEPPDLSRVEPGGSMPVSGYGPLENIPEESAAAKVDIQSLTLDQPLEWSDARDKRTTRMNGPHIRLIQTALEQVGVSVGEDGADGWYGPDSAEGVRKFQRMNGLDETGVFDQRELDVLKKLLEK